MRGSHRHLVLLILAATSSPAAAATILMAALSDFSFDDVSPTTGALRQSMPLCVAMETPGAYRIRATGTGADGAFALTGGVRPLPFSLRFSDRRQGRGRLLSAGQDVAGFTSVQALRGGGCRRLNARVTVRFDAAALEAAAAGRYSGTVLLTVSPE